MTNEKEYFRKITTPFNLHSIKENIHQLLSSESLTHKLSGVALLSYTVFALVASTLAILFLLIAIAPF